MSIEREKPIDVNFFSESKIVKRDVLSDLLFIVRTISASVFAGRSRKKTKHPICGIAEGRKNNDICNYIKNSDHYAHLYYKIQ